MRGLVVVEEVQNGTYEDSRSPWVIDYIPLDNLTGRSTSRLRDLKKLSAHIHPQSHDLSWPVKRQGQIFPIPCPRIQPHPTRRYIV